MESQSDIEQAVRMSTRSGGITSELDRLQEARLVVERKLAAHTGIFGSGFFVRSDPENQALLESLDAQIAEQERNIAASREAVRVLKESLAKPEKVEKPQKAAPLKQAKAHKPTAKGKVRKGK